MAVTPRNKLKRNEINYSAPVDVELWVEMLEAAGMNEKARKRWHTEFERRAPDAHNEFLLSLGIPPAEVARIRRWSRGEIQEIQRLRRNSQ